MIVLVYITINKTLKIRIKISFFRYFNWICYNIFIIYNYDRNILNELIWKIINIHFFNKTQNNKTDTKIKIKVDKIKLCVDEVEVVEVEVEDGAFPII